jgi:hypothetical protein
MDLSIGVPCSSISIQNLASTAAPNLSSILYISCILGLRISNALPVIYGRKPFPSGSKVLAQDNFKWLAGKEQGTTVLIA